MQTYVEDVRNEAVKREDTLPAAPEFSKKVGSITYVVAVHFSRTSAETLEDKLLRMIESEVRDSA